MADSVEIRMSVSSIKRVDPYVKDILSTATHVALYKFNPSSNEWERTETEGALFLYSRSGEPWHSIMIMNRLNTNNLIEPIIKEFEYQMQPPFLLYRNSNNKIFGIWFYNREECVNITYLIESLMEGIKEKLPEKNKKSNGVDIFSMLTKAQEDFNSKTPTKPDGNVLPQYSSTPRTNDPPSQSVMDFFAKASSKSGNKSVASTNDGEHLQPFLQRLMSNPAHSVEHIEKQQRSITPQEHVILRNKPINPDRKNISMSFPNSSTDLKGPENGINFIRVASPQSSVQGPSPLAAFLMQSHNADDSEVRGGSPLAHMLETPQKPQLMPPIMFASTAIKDQNDQMYQREPLTKNQMIQALNYMIRNDPDFVTKLHEAYVKSFTEMINLK